MAVSLEHRDSEANCFVTLLRLSTCVCRCTPHLPHGTCHHPMKRCRSQLSSRAVWAPHAPECGDVAVERDVLTCPSGHRVYLEAMCQLIANGCWEAAQCRRTAKLRNRLRTSMVEALWASTREQQLGRKRIPSCQKNVLQLVGSGNVPTKFANCLVLRQQDARSRQAWTDSFSADLTPTVLRCS